MNQRFDRLILDPLHIHDVDLTIQSFLSDVSPTNDDIYDRIRTKILPKIHHKITKLTINTFSLGCISDPINFVTLTSLCLIDVQSDILLQHLARMLGNLIYFHELFVFCMLRGWYTLSSS